MQLNRKQLSDHTERYKATGRSPVFLEDTTKATAAMKAAAFELYGRLAGFARTGIDRYITRQGGVREIVLKMDVHDIKAFLKHYQDYK